MGKALSVEPSGKGCASIGQGMLAARSPGEGEKMKDGSEEKVSDIGEFGLIDRIGALIGRKGVSSERVILGMGDDTASFLPRPGYEILATCDSMVEGRHYLPGFFSSFDLGRRAMDSNISDVGAMGGRPLYALITLGLEADTAVHEVEELYRGFLAELAPFGASIIGGNVTRSGSGMFIDIFLIGEVEQGKSVRRRGARPGDAVLVTGCPGEAAAGLELLVHGPRDVPLSDHPLVRAFRTPSHRALVGEAVARTGRVTAMIDTSDGFLGDLGHILEASGVGAELFEEKIPVSGALREGALMLGRDPLAFFLGESDDYELIMTCDPLHAAFLGGVAARCCSAPLTEVGRITAGSGITLCLSGGGRRALEATRWDHFRPMGDPSRA